MGVMKQLQRALTQESEVAYAIVAAVSEALEKRFGGVPIGPAEATRWTQVLVSEEARKVARGELRKSATLRVRLRRIARSVLKDVGHADDLATEDWVPPLRSAHRPAESGTVAEAFGAIGFRPRRS